MLVLALALVARAAPIDLNHADAATLEALPGIGPEKAATIVDWRAHHGEFETLDALDEVPGIGRATILAIRRYVTLGTDHTLDAPHAGHPEHRANEAVDDDRVDVNTADVATLAALPGVGADRAAAIVADRDLRGPFPSCDDLVRVDGIGPATVAGLGDRCATN